MLSEAAKQFALVEARQREEMKAVKHAAHVRDLARVAAIREVRIVN